MQNTERASYQENIQRLCEFIKLEENWNDNNAPPISEEVIRKTSIILALLHLQPEIFPLPWGIQIEFESDREYMELEITEKDNIEVFHQKGKDEQKYEVGFWEFVDVLRKRKNCQNQLE